jgi:predicted solute-binding protein
MIQHYGWLFFATSSVSFCFAYVIILRQLHKSQKAFTELYVANKRFQEVIAELNKESRSDSDIHKDNFIKFISDSRDWAFEYIEEVQVGLKRFVDEIAPEINYFKEYGHVSAIQPNYFSLKKITEAYEELLTLLPKEEEVK